MLLLFWKRHLSILNIHCEKSQSRGESTKLKKNWTTVLLYPVISPFTTFYICYSLSAYNSIYYTAGGQYVFAERVSTCWVDLLTEWPCNVSFTFYKLKTVSLLHQRLDSETAPAYSFASSSSFSAVRTARSLKDEIRFHTDPVLQRVLLSTRSIWAAVFITTGIYVLLL